MTTSTKKTVIRTFVGSLGAASIIVIGLLHNSWGDDRYELQDDARIKAIQSIDTQLAIKDTEILFAEDDREKEKLKAIKAIYERQKQALREKPQS